MKKVGILLRILIFLFYISFSLNFVSAKYLYVSTNGSDSVSYANNDINSPWLTPQKAWYNAQAGDIVYFRSGTYTISGTIDTTRTNGYDGRLDAWIEFTSYGSENVTIRGTNTPLETMFKIGRKYNYIHHLNFDINGDARGFMVGYDLSAGVDPVTGFRVEHCTFSNWADGDNHTPFYIGENCVSVKAKEIILRYNTITGRSSASYQNYGGIILFGVDNYTIENNEISHVVRGIFLKHSSRNYADTGKKVRYNWIHDQQVSTSASSGRLGAIALSDNYVTVSHNICHHGINVGEDGQGGAGSPIGNYNIIDHNTGMAIQLEADKFGDSINNIITNNIVASRTIAGSGNTWDYNIYTSGDAIGDNDLGNTQPIFVGGTNPTTILGFALTSSSPGYRNASDLTDKGANVSKVGVNALSGEIPTCTENWNCTTWSTCSNSLKTRTCIDLNNCGTIVNRSELTQSCTNPIQENLYNECTNYSTNHPEWIFCDDFESTTPIVSSSRYFEYNNSNGEFIPINNAGVNNSRAMRALFHQGEVGAGSLNLAFGRTSVGSSNTIRNTENFREVYYRMYLKLDSNWQGCIDHNSGKLSRATVFSSSDWSQAMIAHLWSDSDNYKLMIDPVSCVVGGTVQCVGYNDFNHVRWIGATQGQTPIFNGSYNQWLCIENHIKLNDPGQQNGIQEFWINNNLEAIKSGLNFTGTYTSYGINAIFFENWCNNGSIKEQSRYFDNIVVSTQRIGCGNYTIQPPTLNVTTMQKLLNNFGNFKSGGSLSDYIIKIKEFILG
jgi:hypothetical protein